jgi:hypothetical protein
VEHGVDVIEFECRYDAAYWLGVALSMAIILAMGAMTLAVAGSRFARAASFAAMGSAPLVLAVGALVPYLPSGSAISTEVRDWAAEQQRRHDEGGMTPDQIRRVRKERAAWEAHDRHNCISLGAAFAFVPLVVGGAALGLAYARARAKRDEQDAGPTAAS